MSKLLRWPTESQPAVRSDPLIQATTQTGILSQVIQHYCELNELFQIHLSDGLSPETEGAELGAAEGSALL